MHFVVLLQVRYLYGALLILVVTYDAIVNRSAVDKILHLLISELPNCFAAVTPDPIYPSTSTFGTFGPYWPSSSIDDSKMLINKSSSGGQLLALLHDYAYTVSHNVERLVQLNIPTMLIK